MLLLPLLLFFALLNPSSGAEGFDANRCKHEMMCFVPGSCISENIDSLTRWPDAPYVDKCPVVIAIRSYSDKKWLVAMRGKGTGPKGLQLKISDKLKFECKPDTTPGNATIDVVPATSKDRVFSSGYDQANNYILCEFVVVQPIIGELVLKYSLTGAQDFEWRLGRGTFEDQVKIELKKGCNPDDITFKKKDSGTELHFEVDSRRFDVTCPKDSQLTFSKDDSNYVEISGLTCVPDPRPNGGGGQYQVASAVPVPKGNKIAARCVQYRCALCPEVAPQTGLDKANFTKGSSDACATLTCPGNRFAIGDSKERLKGQQPVCLDGQWSIAGKHFATASCYVDYDCVPLKCAGCRNVTTTSVRCSGKLTLAHDGQSKVNISGLHCDGATGKWRAKGEGGQDREVDPATATITCARKAVRKHEVRGAATVQLVVGAVGTLVCGSMFILTLIVGYRMFTRVPIEEHTSDESRLEEGGSAEQHHDGGRRHHNDDVSSGGVTGSTTSQASCGSIKASETSVHTGIPTRPEPAPPTPAAPSSTPASAPAASAAGPQPQSDPPPRNNNNNNNQAGARNSAEMLDDDHGYVIIDPEEHEKECKRQEAAKAAKAAAAAAAPGGAKTEKVGVLPPLAATPAATPAAAPPASTPAAATPAATAEQQQQTPPTAPTETTPPDMSPPQPEAKTQ